MYLCPVQQKNYYRLLGVAPGASSAEIKAAYRRLALRYHPDKNAEDTAAEQVFKEINEAYTVLSDEHKRAVYHRKHSGIFSAAANNDTVPVTAQAIYEKLCALHKNFEHADPYRMDKDTLAHQLGQLFSAYHLSVLKQENNLSLNNAIIDKALALLGLLKIDRQKKILELLEDMPHGRERKINAFIKRQQQAYFWEKYKLLLVLIAAISICLLMYFFIR